MMGQQPFKTALLLLVAVSASAIGQEKAAAPLTFEKDIRPILQARCSKCHLGKSAKAGLDLSKSVGLIRGGKSGPAIRIRAAEFSLFYERIASNEMPKGGPPLTDKQKGVIRSWINEGAKGIGKLTTVIEDEVNDNVVWSFQPPTRPALPDVRSHDRVRNAVDRFVIQRLESEGLSLAPEASKLVLLRRVYYDLLGLPPSQDDVRMFLQDTRPDAYGRMVERLLASPAYGERWGRHWLDVAGYADSAGILNEDRALPLAFRYRDYVIRAFNADKPYDRFLQEQIAGDELTKYWDEFNTKDSLSPTVIEGITATGFLRTAPDSSRPDFKTIKNADALYFYPTIDATMKIVASATMGLTIQCARCHSHKFDPIAQTEYYRLQSIFMSAYRPREWIPQMERRRWTVSAAGKKRADARNAEVAANIKNLNAELASLRKAFGDRLFELRLKKLPAAAQAVVRAAFVAPAKKRSPEQKKTVATHQANLRPDAKKLDGILKKTFPDYAAKVQTVADRTAAEQRRRMYYDEIRALYDLPGPVHSPL